MLRLIAEHRLFFLGTTVAGLALRLFFVFYFPAVTDDSRIYAELATNWLQHGVYGQTQGAPQAAILPTDTRLPGYPAFLAVIFWLFGAGNFRAVLLAQVVLDIATCFVVADLARRAVSERAACIAFVLAALCPFLANYSAAVLTETLEVFFTALALDGAASALHRLRARSAAARNKTFLLWAGTGLALAACILLRPDGGILLAVVVAYAVYVATVKSAPQRQQITAAENRSAPRYRDLLAPFLRASLAAITVAVFALAPLAPWTIRNFRALHHFQPLAPRYANDSDELVPRGFNRWVKTWIADYVSVQEIYWNVPGDKIDADKLPARAFDSASQRDATMAAIADYNDSQDMTPEVDARFAALAAERIRAHPLRYYVLLPAMRIADMWLRPRTELLPPDPRWWEFRDDLIPWLTAVGFGLLNLVYVGFALLGLARERSKIRWLGLMLGFLLLRSAFLATLENPEPRYTLECYPVVILCAAVFLADVSQRRRKRASTDYHPRPRRRGL